MALNCKHGNTGAAEIQLPIEIQLADVVSAFNPPERERCMMAIRGDLSAAATLPAGVGAFLNATLKKHDRSVPPERGEGPSVERATLAERTAAAIQQLDLESKYVVEWGME